MRGNDPWRTFFDQAEEYLASTDDRFDVEAGLVRLQEWMAEKVEVAEPDDT